MSHVSVIIPVHNRADILPETLDSVLGQSFEDWECLIIDDHSTDNSLEIAESYAYCDSRFRAIPLPDPTRYVNAARNYGLSLATGKCINFLDSDDLFEQDKLATQVAYLDSHPDVDMVTCLGKPFRITPGDVQRALKVASSDRWLEAVLFQPEWGTLWPSHGPLWRKSAIMAVGEWDESIRNFTDPELNFRALAAGLNIVRLESVLVHWRIAGDSHSHLSALVPLYRAAIHRMWDGYVRFDLVTPLRQRVFARRVFQIAQSHVYSGQFAAGIRIWLEDTNRVGIPKVEALIGSLILLAGCFSYRLGKMLRTKYFDRLYAQHFNGDR